MKREVMLLAGVGSLALSSLAAGQFPGYDPAPNSPANSFYTNVNPPAPGELGHAAILGGHYGGTFTAATFTGDRAGFLNAALGIRAVRVLDATDNNGSAGSNIDMLQNSAFDNVTDQVWTDGVANVNATAVFAGFSQSFGYASGAAGGNYSELFSVSGTGFNVTGGATGINMSGLWRWARAGQGLDGTSVANANVQTSLAADNSGGSDQMVTYEIQQDAGGGNWVSLSGLRTWLLFFEDKTIDHSNPDWDFNDLVIEIVVIPLPAPVWMGLAGLVGVAALRRRKLRD